MRAKLSKKSERTRKRQEERAEKKLYYENLKKDVNKNFVTKANKQANDLNDNEIDLDFVDQDEEFDNLFSN